MNAEKADRADDVTRTYTYTSYHIISNTETQEVVGQPSKRQAQGADGQTCRRLDSSSTRHAAAACDWTHTPVARQHNGGKHGRKNDYM